MLSAALLLLCAPLAHAQDHKTVDFNFEEPPDGFGIGIILGDPSGLSIAFRKGEKSAVQAHFGWSTLNESFHISVDYLYNVVIFDTPDMAGVRFPLYIGVGGRFQSYGNRFDGDPGVGVRIPIGMAILPRSLAIDPFVEVVPTVLIVPETEAGFEGGIGIRLYF